MLRLLKFIRILQAFFNFFIHFFFLTFVDVFTLKTDQ